VAFLYRSLNSLTDACFIVRDARQVLAYVCFEEEPGRRAAAHLLTRRVNDQERPPTHSMGRDGCNKVLKLARSRLICIVLTPLVGRVRQGVWPGTKRRVSEAGRSNH
jgi:hypothetical protein